MVAFLNMKIIWKKVDRIHKQMQKQIKKYENNMKKYENQPGACQRLKNGGFEEFLKCSLRGSCLFLVTLFSYFFIFAKIGFSHFIFQEFIRFIFFQKINLFSIHGKLQGHCVSNVAATPRKRAPPSLMGSFTIRFGSKTGVNQVVDIYACIYALYIYI